jgi:3-isopropylmalate dehydratase small subunit
MAKNEVVELGGGAYTVNRNRGKKMTKKEKWVEVEIDLDDATFLALAKEAHQQDITFNQLANKILLEQMDKIDAEEKAEKKEKSKKK